MQSKTMRLQNAQQHNKQQAASTRKPPQAQTTMATEYQDRFLPPRCYMTFVTTSAQKHPYHPLRATTADVTTFRSYYVANKKMKNLPKAPQPAVPPKGHQRSTNTPHNPARSEVNHWASTVEDYTSVYQNDFQAWKGSKRQPCKLHDSLQVSQGLVVTKSASKEGRSQKSCVQVADNSKAVPEVQEQKPFESATSYRSDYISHPVQPRIRREKPVYQPNIGLLPVNPAVSSRPKVTWEMNQADEFFQQFKTWSLETQFYGEGHAKASSPAVLPSMQTSEKSKKPFQATTSMKEDNRTWNAPQRFPIVHKERHDWPKKTTFSVWTRKTADSCKPVPKPVSPHCKLNESAVCNSSCDATEKPQCPAENGALSSSESISAGSKEFTRFWTTSLDRGATWPDGDICKPTK